MKDSNQILSIENQKKSLKNTKMKSLTKGLLPFV